MNLLLEMCAGALLVTALLTVWRRSQRGVVRVLAGQGVALAALVAVVSLRNGDFEGILVVILVLALRGVVLPRLLGRRLETLGGDPALDDEAPLLNPTATVVLSAVLTVVAYAVSAELFPRADVAARLTPIGIAVVLIGLLAMSTRRRAVSQLVGFLVLDDGITAVAFFSSGGVPLLVEFAASFDLLLVIAILQVFTVRLEAAFGDTDVHELRELHD